MISMIPVFLLVAASILLQVLGRVKFSPGQTWLFSSIVALLSWMAMILIRIVMPSGWQVTDWLPGMSTLESVAFQFSKETWVPGFLLISLLVAVIFYEARFLGSGNYVNILSGTLTISAFGLLSILSANGLTFLLTWALIDIAEFSILMLILKEESKHQIAITSLFARSVGIIFMTLLLVLQSRSGFYSPENENPAYFGIIMILVAILRMGIIPSHVPYSEDPKIRIGIGSILRFTPIFSVFSFLMVSEPQNYSPSQTQWLMAILLFAAVFGVFSWFLANNKLAGRSYWIFTLGCLALIGYLRASAEVITGLSAMLMAGATVLFVPAPRTKGGKIFIPLLMAGLLCLPYTPTAILPVYFWGERFTVANILIVACLSLLIAGLIFHTIRAEEDGEHQENWVRLFQIFGLIILMISPWISEIFILGKISSLNYWWYAVVLCVVTGLIMTARFYLNHETQRNIRTKFLIRRGFDSALLISERFFRFEWITRIMKGIGEFIAVSMNLLIRILEGDGGILWSFLFLVLLASLLITGQGR